MGEVLLNGVLERFRVTVETQRLSVVRDLTEEDCRIVDEEMTECSRWMHDQPAAEGGQFPGPDALEERINAIQTRVKTVADRRA